MEKQQREQVEKNMREAREKLESEMEDAYHEHQANLLRQGTCRYEETVAIFSLALYYNMCSIVFIQIC